MPQPANSRDAPVETVSRLMYPREAETQIPLGEDNKKSKRDYGYGEFDSSLVGESSQVGKEGDLIAKHE